MWNTLCHDLPLMPEVTLKHEIHQTSESSPAVWWHNIIRNEDAFTGTELFKLWGEELDPVCGHESTDLCRALFSETISIDWYV